MRGGAEQFIEETERSLHDAIMIVRRAIKNDSIVAGRYPLINLYNERIVNIYDFKFFIIIKYMFVSHRPPHFQPPRIKNF